MKKSNGFTLIELLVVIAIISLISAMVFAAMSTARQKARDSQRIQNARHLGIAIEQYEQTNNTYKVNNSGYNNTGSGYVAKGSESLGYSSSIISALKTSGFYNSNNLKDPVFGTDNYYLGLCTSTNAYNIYLKVEQSSLQQSTTTVSSGCDGLAALSRGFNYVTSSVGGNSGGVADPNTYKSGPSYACGSTVVGIDSITYGTVLAPDGRCWLDRNLGATRVATAYNDIAAYGYYYQWGRGFDGHQASTSQTTSTKSVIDTPAHNKFILSISSPYDWRSTQNNNLWQGTSGINNPCPVGFRLPTQFEWQAWVTNAGITNYTNAFTSSLKLTAAGFHDRTAGALYDQGVNGYYYTSDITGTDASSLTTDVSFVNPSDSSYRADALSVRCIKD